MLLVPFTGINKKLTIGGETMGTHDGGITAYSKNTKKDPLFYSKIGAKGGATRTAATKNKGFGSNRARASMAGKIGGRNSRKLILVS
jgi:general stress protein YciG